MQFGIDFELVHAGPDDRAGEMYPAFPHDPTQADDPYYAFSSTPESSEYLLAAAYAVVKAERMGMDEVPDFLALSISGTDIVGHIWGARSWEYADNLARIDRALTRFSRLLEARGPVAFVLTADHGVAELPERAAAAGRSGGRLSSKTLTLAAEKAADEAPAEEAKPKKRTTRKRTTKKAVEAEAEAPAEDA